MGDTGIDRWIFRKLDVGVWTGMELAQNREKWRAIMNAVINIWVP